MAKNYTNRKISYWSKEVGVFVEVFVDGYGNLDGSELKIAADQIADGVMLAISRAQYIRAPISRIEAKTVRG